MVLSIALASAGALILYFEEHYWLIPVFVLCNILLSWILLKELVFKSFLFSYG